MNYSTQGYKTDSPDRNNEYNIIPGRLITMKGVARPLMLVPIVNGKPDYNRKRNAKPGDPDIEFEEDVESVLELPYAQIGLTTQPDFVDPYMNNFDPNFIKAVNIGTGTQRNTVYNPVASDNSYIQSDIDPVLQDQIGSNNIVLPNSQAPVQTQTESIDFNKLQKERQPKKDEEEKKKPFIGAINPYGGWNMANTSVMLGASVENKNALGITGSIGKLALEGGRNYMAGKTAMKRYNEDLEEYYDTMEEEERIMGLSYKQKGGKVGKELTGNYVRGNETHPNPNVEVEKGEYLQSPDGRTAEVMGKRHSEGGELMKVPDETKVVSDYLKIGSKLASYFKKEHGLNVKSGSTFATVLDRYKKKIGLTELLDKETVLMDKIVDQEKVEFEGTRDINLQVLSEKVNELKPEKESLESKFEVFTNLVYSRQEELKSEDPSLMKKQQGGEVDDPDKAMEDNGQPIPQEETSEVEMLILQYAEITGSDPSEIIAQLQQLPEEQLQQAIQQISQTVGQQEGQQSGGQQSGGGLEEIIMTYSQMNGLNPEEVMTELSTMDENEANQVIQEMVSVVQSQSQPQQESTAVMKEGGMLTKSQFLEKLKNQNRDYIEYEYGDLPRQKEALIPRLKKAGIEFGDSDLTTQQSQNNFAGKYQTYMRDTNPLITTHHSQIVDPTQKGLQTALDNGLITATKLKDFGINVSANGKTVLRGSKNTVPKDRVNELVQYISKQGESNPEAYKKYVDNNFVDNQWYYRALDIEDVEFENKEELDNFAKDYKLIDKDKNIYYSDKQGLYFTPHTKKGAKPTETKTETPLGVVENPDPNEGLDPMENLDRPSQDGLPMLTPDQSNLAPNLLSPGIRTIGHVQANAIKLSPEDTIRELNRQYRTALDVATESNPYASQAINANLHAQTANSVAQAYSQTAIANAQDERNVANINEERIQNRDIYNTGKLDNYEKLAQTALHNYTQSWRNYIDKRNLENVNNWNLENQRQAFNATNDNYKIGSMGWYQTDEKPEIILGSNNAMFMRDLKTGEVNEVTVKTNPDGTRTTVEKNKTQGKPHPRVNQRKKGGRINSSDFKNILLKYINER